MAKETITLNNKVYKAKEIDFNFICELGMNGVDLQDMDKKIFPAIRIYLAYCMGTDNINLAGNELEKHLVNGGSFEEIADVFREKAETSDFFRAMAKESNESSEEKTSARNTKKKTEE